LPPDRVERLIGTERTGKITEFRINRSPSRVKSSSPVSSFSTATESIELKPGDILKGKIIAIFKGKKGKEVEVDFGSFKVRARWNSYLIPEIGKNILVLVKDTSTEIVLKLLETKVTNFKDFFVKNFTIRETIFSLVNRVSIKSIKNEGNITSQFIKNIIENSGLFLENKLFKGNLENIKIDLKAKLLSEFSKASGSEVITISKSLNLLESYALSNIFSKNFFLVPLFLPLPPFNRAELFIDKEELRNFYRSGFLTVVIVLDLEKYGKLKISVLFDRQENFFEINFTSESGELIEELKKRHKDIIDFLGSKYKVKITYTNQAPELPELQFENIPVEIDITV
jgi:hypothetical protein